MKIFKLCKLFLVICSLLYSIANANIYSKISDKELVLNDSPFSYSFIVSGHTYGTPSGSLYPAASLLANLQFFNSLKPSFMMLLGDAIQHQGAENGIGELEIEIFQKSFSNKLDFPLFNSPGNHDLSIRTLYEKYFGKTYFDFQQSSELFIVLDTELGPGFSDKAQRDYLIDLIQNAKNRSDIKNVFIFMHRTLWAVNNPPVDSINPWVNGGPRSGSSEFNKVILPELNKLARDKNVYLLSGDIGLKNYELNKFPQESFSLFYQKHDNITYIANGLAENENDSVIIVNVSSEGEVTFKPVSLIGNKLGDINQYDVNYWKQQFPIIDNAVQEVDFKKRVYERVKNIMKSKRFILGTVFLLFISFIIIIILTYLLRKNKKAL